MRKSLKLIAFTIGALTLGGFLFFGAHRAGFFQIQNINIVFEPQATWYDGWSSDLRKKWQSFYGKQIWELSLSDISKDIEPLNWVQEHRIWRVFPNTIEIHIVPKEVRALLQQKSNFIPMADDGELLPAVVFNSAPSAPVIHQEIFKRDTKLRKKLSRVLGEIPDDGSFSQHSLSTVEYRMDQSFWFSVTQSPIQIHLGQENIELRARRVSQVLDYLQNHDLNGRIIDADFSKKVLVKLRKRR